MYLLTHGGIVVGTMIKQVPHTCKIRQIRAISVRKKHSRIYSS